MTSLKNKDDLKTEDDLKKYEDDLKIIKELTTLPYTAIAEIFGFTAWNLPYIFCR